MSDLLSRLLRKPAELGFRKPMSQIKRLVTGDHDNRITVADVEKNPWRPFCCMKINFIDGERYAGYGTGLLIRPRIILTAAHNLYSLKSKIFAKKIVAMVGVKGEQPAAEAHVTHVEVCSDPAYRNFRHDEAAQYSADYGIAILDSDALFNWAGEYVNVVDQAPLTGPDLIGSRLNVAGYPDEKPRTDDGAKRHPDLKTDSGPLIPATLTATNFRYQMDTKAGQSGCPVFKYYPDSKRFLFAGVHVAGHEGSDTNLARRYDERMRNQVKSWVRQFG